MVYAEGLARLLDNTELLRKLDKIKKMKCKHSIRHSSIVILHELTEICASNLLTFGETTLLKFYYHFQSENCTFDVVENKLTFSTKNELHLAPSEIKVLDCVLHSR